MSWRDRRWAGDEETFTPGGRPVGTLWILGVTAGALLLLWVVGGGARGEGTRLAIDWLAIRGDVWWQLWRSLTYALLHGGIGHLISNLLYIGIAGWILEQAFGTRTFVKIYLGLVAFSSLGFVVPAAITGEALPCIGASGGALGLIVLLGSKFPRLTLHVWGIIPVRCWLLATILVALDLFTIAGRYDTNVASGVHLAGAAGGFAIGFLGPRFETWREEVGEARSRRREAKVRERDAAEQGELDRLLDKISREGMDKLTERERQFLLSQSEKLKGGGRR